MKINVSKKSVYLGSVAEPRFDQRIADAIRTGAMPVEPLPGYEGSDIGFSVGRASLEGYELPFEYVEDLDAFYAEHEERFRAQADATVEAIAQEIPPGAIEYHNSFNEEDTRTPFDLGQRGPAGMSKYLGVDPRWLGPRLHELFKGAIVIDLSNPTPEFKLSMVAVLETYAAIGIDHSVLGLKDTMVNVDGRDIYLQLQFELKSEGMLVSIGSHDHVDSLLHLAESCAEAVSQTAVSWMLGHMLTLAEMIDRSDFRGEGKGMYATYLGAMDLPVQPVIDSKPDIYRQARDYLGKFCRSMSVEKNKGFRLMALQCAEQFR